MLLPTGVTTLTAIAPALCGGVMAVIWFALTTVKLRAFTPPKVTAVAPVKLLPLILVVVLPAIGPDAGNTLWIPGVVEPVTEVGLILKNKTINSTILSRPAHI